MSHLGRIPVSGPWITNKEIDYVTDAVTNAWYDNANKYNQKFEEAFASYIGTKYAIALPSCTSAIHLSLLALGVGPGDEVIVPDVTWIASAAPIQYVGATPVFADIDENSWCLSAHSFENKITDRTKAVIPVDLYGNMANWDQIRSVALKHKIAVIEDAAEALGSEYKGKKAGSLGDVGVFSFHGSKTLTTGEGGMLVTDRVDIYNDCLFLRDHGRKPGDKMFWNTEVGYKYKMSSMQAALGLAQLERVEEIVSRKREIFSWYESQLLDLSDIQLNFNDPYVKSSYWMITVILNKELGLNKETLISKLSDQNIDSRPFFYPLSMLPAFKELGSVQESQRNNRNSYSISPWGINLPSGLNLTKDQVGYICDKLIKIVKE
ncbi:glutamine--scyllo-inositol aminotransferase [Paenibacillus odorifer]|uniref:Glutamine--scyllo-inositol aminotransferase n=1 Tax=Paenibacillus odorifer TaxID=189426 RepID=A0A1R0WVU8_9BACL|nr:MULTISPECIES: DegT/DnrJ/EryC1/StrS family aminotransferase [Paenibacillus]ETT65508.1 glutamine--scyllo-inositol transaminase [Paenibacillus sp. FSL H8-237]OMD22466.1 glutamine--scyllo-inositol aminotransferase [Paenibacillus odorifer]OME44823.1 glutamine--scyllo-inositol aminotransferase [Paenibacillus odorifer]OME59206.1 glutamine--scyllo-inositol aminotransferase [Paenibacillus odorifer]